MIQERMTIKKKTWGTSWEEHVRCLNHFYAHDMIRNTHIGHPSNRRWLNRYLNSYRCQKDFYEVEMLLYFTTKYDAFTIY